MKIRTDYVTNSSSSSFILSFSSEESIESEIESMLPRRSSEIKKIIVNDAKNARKFTKLEIIDAVSKAIPVFDEYGLVQFPELNDEGLEDLLSEFWYKAEYEVEFGSCRNRFLSLMPPEYYNSKEYKGEVMEIFDQYIRLFDEYDDSDIFVEVEYGDNGSAVYSDLEHNILPHISLIRFSHH